MGWKLLPAILLGGVTYISSSGIIARVLAELGRLKNPETPVVLSALVLEDLAMAVYLPLTGALIAGGGRLTVAISLAVAHLVVLFALQIAVRYGASLSGFAAHQADETILLTVLGTILLVAGVAQRFQVSAAIGAFLVGSRCLAQSLNSRTGYLRPFVTCSRPRFSSFSGLRLIPPVCRAYCLPRWF
jgi:CPA2 family monovalent cation:H+ antiporter-2